MPLCMSRQSEGIASFPDPNMPARVAKACHEQCDWTDNDEAGKASS